MVLTDAASPPSAGAVWSVPLSGRALAARPLGGCLVFGEKISVYSDIGHLLSSSQTHGAGIGEPVMDSTGVVYDVEGEEIVGWDMESWRILRTIQAPGALSLAIAPWGDLLYFTLAAGECTVHCVSRQGGNRWSFPLPGVGTFAFTNGFTAMGDVVVVEDVGGLRALDATGATAWFIGHDGLRRLGDNPAPPEYTEPFELDSDLLSVDSDRVLMTLYGTGLHGAFVLDSATPGLREVSAGDWTITPPWAVVRDDGGPADVVSAGGAVKGRAILEYPVRRVTLDSVVKWEVRLPAEPVAVVACPDGAVLVAATPSAEHWEKYPAWFDRSEYVFVRCIEPDGSTRWVWHPPGRLTHWPVVGEDGLMYAGSDGRLWAVPLADPRGGAPAVVRFYAQIRPGGDPANPDALLRVAKGVDLDLEQEMGSAGDWQDTDFFRSPADSAGGRVAVGIEPEAWAVVYHRWRAEGRIPFVEGVTVPPLPRVDGPVPEPGSGPVTPAMAQAIADAWYGGPEQRGGVYEFDIGYVVYPLRKASLRRDRSRPPSDTPTSVRVIDKATGERGVWPALALPDVATMYRRDHGPGTPAS